MPKIKIFATHNTPYARLSNNFKQEMRIGGLRYNTVTNYVYSNMLSTPIWKTSIRRATPISTCTGEGDCDQYKRSRRRCIDANCTHKVLTVGDQFSKLYEDEKYDRRKEALEIAVNAKLKQNPELEEELIETDNRPIIYVSRGKWMGKKSPDDDDGENNYGKILMAIRYRLKGERDQRIRMKDESKREETMYEIYLAYNNLQRLISAGNNLNDYNGLTAPQVLKKMEENGINVLRVPDKVVVVSEARRKNYGIGPRASGGILNNDMFLVLKKPKILVSLVRGSYLGKERDRKLNKVPGLILDMYCDYILKKSKQFQDIDPKDYAKARKQQLDTLPVLERHNLGKELANLYERGMLSESLSKNIDVAIETLDIPSEEDVKDAKEMANVIRGSISFSDQQENISISSRPSGSPIIIWENDPIQPDPTYKLKGLSPLDTSVNIRIGSKNYPSITYYCIAVELTKCCLGLKKRKVDFVPDRAYNMMLVDGKGSFLDLRTLERKLERLSQEAYREKLMANTKEALKVKFSDRMAQNVLLSTKNANLVYDDRNDPILGTKLPEAFNYVGKELMRLRDDIRESRKETGYMNDVGDVLSLKVLHTVFQNDFLRSWFNMRVRDMCSVIMVMKDYMYLKYQILQKITPEFITSVLDGIYQPCSTIFATANDINVPPPMQFIRMVEKYKGFLGFIPSPEDKEKVLDIMWRRLAVIIYYLMKHLEQSTTNNIAIVLKKVEELASLTKNCVKVLHDEKENCIFSALRNIIRGIHALDRKYRDNSVLKEVDFNAAVTILLNVNSLAEQRAMQRKMSNKIEEEEQVYTLPPPGLTNEYIESVRNRLRGITKTYDEDVIDKVIEDIIQGGRVVEGDQIDFLAMSYKDHKPSKPIKVHRRPRESKQKYMERVRKAQAASEKFSPPESEYAEIPFDKEEEELDFSDDENFDIPEDYDDEDEEKEEVLEKEDKSFFVPDPEISHRITQAFISDGIDVSKVDSFVFMLDESIEFVKSYTAISSKMKTNRINFFASPQWGTTMA